MRFLANIGEMTRTTTKNNKKRIQITNKPRDEAGSVETTGRLFLCLSYKADTDVGPWELKHEWRSLLIIYSTRAVFWERKYCDNSFMLPLLTFKSGPAEARCCVSSHHRCCPHHRHVWAKNCTVLGAQIGFEVWCIRIEYVGISHESFKYFIRIQLIFQLASPHSQPGTCR